MSAGDFVVVRGMQVGVSSSSIRPGVKDPLNVQATILFSPISAGVSGSGLWRLGMYGSRNADGRGDQYQRVYQTLTDAQQDQALVGDRLDFVDAFGEMDITGIGCGEFTFLCFDFAKGSDPSTDFKFVSLKGSDKTTFTLCTRRPCSQPGGSFVSHF